MSKVIEFPGENAPYRAALREARVMVADMAASLQGQTVRAAMIGPRRGELPEGAESELPWFGGGGLLGVEDRAMQALVHLIRTMNSTLEALPQVESTPDEDTDGAGAEDTDAKHGLFDEHDRDLVEVLSYVDGVEGWLEHSDLSGEGLRPVRLVEVESFGFEASHAQRQVTMVGVACDADGRQGRIRVVAYENRQPMIEQFQSAMRGRYEWLELPGSGRDEEVP